MKNKTLDTIIEEAIKHHTFCIKHIDEKVCNCDVSSKSNKLKKDLKAYFISLAPDDIAEHTERCMLGECYCGVSYHNQAIREYKANIEKGEK